MSKEMQHFGIIAILLAAICHGINSSVPMQLDGRDQMNMLDLINQERRSVQPPATEMKKVNWCRYLEGLAKEASGGCGRTMQSTPYRVYREFDRPVEGLLTDTMQWLLEQKQHYDARTMLCKEPANCFRYRQIIYSKMEYVGCAAANCSGLGVLVCVFQTFPTMEDLQYSVGESMCTHCPRNYTCEDQLCVRNDRLMKQVTPKATENTSTADALAQLLQTTLDAIAGLFQ